MPRDKSSWQPSSQKRQKQPKQPRAPQSNVPEQESDLQDDAISITLQQSLLNIFRDACNKGPPSQIEEVLQEVKGHLYNRDFAVAFGKDEYLEAYAARWSPSRALGYAQIFSDLSCQIAKLSENKLSNFQADAETSHQQKTAENEIHSSNSLSNTTEDEASTLSTQLEGSLKLQGDTYLSNSLKVVCLGGGAGAEVVGLAGWLKCARDTSSSEEGPQSAISKLDILGIDIAKWDKVMQDLHQGVITPPALSKYASAAAKATNVALLPHDVFDVQFKQQDLLTAEAAEIRQQLAGADLVTIMFTLNELYTASVPRTQRLLYALTDSLRPGALLLVVDSPGSYSTVTINGAEKKYPMQWLLDHTLLSVKKGETTPPQWRKLVSDESRWFRLPKAGLRYPIELENMRYQIHLYQRCEEMQPKEDK